MSESKIKFTWALVITSFFSIIFGVVSFMGVNFLNINNDKVWGMPHTIGSVIIALVITFLLGGTALSAIMLKRTSRKFKTSFIWEVISLVLFLLLAVFLASKDSPFSHFFTVLSHKEDIKSKLQASINQTEDMFVSYEDYADNRKNSYETKLKTVVKSKSVDPITYHDYGFNTSVHDSSQIKTKMFTLNAVLFPSNYSDTVQNNGIKEVAVKWLENAKGITNSPFWILSISGIVNDIEKKSNNWLNTLVGFSKDHDVKFEPFKYDPFDYSLGYTDVVIHFTKLENPSVLAIILASLAYILILLSYVLTKRSTKSVYGFRSLLFRVFGTKKKEKKEFDIEY